MAVPEGAERPEDLELIGAATAATLDVELVDAEDDEQVLDVPDRAVTLLDALQEHGELGRPVPEAKIVRICGCRKRQAAAEEQGEGR